MVLMWLLPTLDNAFKSAANDYFSQQTKFRLPLIFAAAACSIKYYLTSLLVGYFFPFFFKGIAIATYLPDLVLVFNPC